MKPKVSIIVPCYNVEKYIEQCVNSIINQTLKEIEIILVNDGSTDNTLSILQQFAANDERIILIDLKNGGYGRAVNAGLAKSTGEYVGIVESDDFITDKMFETLYGLTLEGTVEIAKGNFWDYYEYEGKTPEAVVNNERKDMPDVEYPFTIRQRPEILWGHPSIWSGIYKRELIFDNGIKFIEAKGGGWVDNPFFFETLCKAKSIVWTKEPFYFYRKTNPNASSVRQSDPTLPFVRMMDNLDVLEREHYTDDVSLKYAYARALMYMRGAIAECDYQTNYDIINEYAQRLMRRLDSEVIFSEFNTHDQKTYLEYASPIKTLQAQHPKILLYNWLPFDNPWGWGGGVNIYCKNVIKEFLNKYPSATIYFLSSGFAYSAKTTDVFYRKLATEYDERVHQYEVVNSPIPAEQKYVCNNPLPTLNNTTLKNLFNKFIETFGDFSAIHFQNIEGLSLDIFDLKQNFPDTKFIYSLHNYIPSCVTGFYYQRHARRICDPKHTGEDCIKCAGTNVETNIAHKTYLRGLFGHNREECMQEEIWIQLLGFGRFDQPATNDNILQFAKTATEKINKNCDSILAVSKRVYEVAAAEGFDKSKMSVSYIGTRVANRQIGHSLATPNNGLKVVYLGNDIHYEEKGYPWLLNTLEKLDKQDASRIDLVLTLRNDIHDVVYDKLKNFRSLKIYKGYTHKDLGKIFDGCHLGLVPVLWEDNLPQIAIEMAAYGVPVLSSDAGGASELSDSPLFRFKAGNEKDFSQKLIHLLNTPNDLEQYWVGHNGLVTMEQHLNQLINYYGLPKEPKSITISQRDYAYLLMERDFLRRHGRDGNHSQQRRVDYQAMQDLENIKNSLSFRVGRAITYLPRKLRDLIKRKKHQI